jgi:hypothetical protein
MNSQNRINMPVLRRRDLGTAALALGVAAMLRPRPAAADSLSDRIRNALLGELSDLSDDGREEVAYYVGLEAYVFGYPLVVMDVSRAVLTAAAAPNGEGTVAPINQLARMPHYVSPYYTNVVRISLNSLWTTGWLDLEKEPMVLSVPDTHDRYYVFSVMNMWTDVFASIGKRTSGTGPGSFLIAGPNWDGTPPAGIKETHRSSTRYAWALGQTQANGPDDFAAVNALQAEYKLTPLSAWGTPYAPPDNVPVDGSVALTPSPPIQVANMDAATFFNRLALVMRDNPPICANLRVV